MNRQLQNNSGCMVVAGEDIQRGIQQGAQLAAEGTCPLEEMVGQLVVGHCREEEEAL